MAPYVYIAISSDGFIATLDEGVDWLNDIPNPDQSDCGYAEFISGIDALVMGRRTFEKVLTFGIWPWDKPVFVCCVQFLALTKIFAWQLIHRNGILREIKRLELRITELPEKTEMQE